MEPPPSYEASLEGSVSRLDPIVEETSFMMGNSVEDNDQAATTADNGKKKAYLIASLTFGVLIIVIAIFVFFIYGQIKEHDKFDTLDIGFLDIGLRNKKVNPMTSDDHPGWETTPPVIDSLKVEDNYGYGERKSLPTPINPDFENGSGLDDGSNLISPVDDEHDQ